MRSFKMLGALAAVFALSAIGAANASAATFTASAGGSLSGKALAHQSFTTSGGTVTCKKATTTGTIAGLQSTSQHVRVEYSECTAFGFASIHISDATYEFTAHTGTNVHIKNTITITPTLFGSDLCTITIPPQTVGTVDYANSGTSNVKVTPTVTGIHYTSSGSVCGEAGTYTNGTYTGANEINGTASQILRYDHP